jgi:nucleotide-binding universal stress UspA family protein
LIKKILLPQDGSPNAKSALECSLWLAGKFEASLVGLHVVNIVALEGPFLHDVSGSLGFEPFLNFSTKMKEALEANGKTVLNTFAEECRKAGFSPETHLSFGVVVNEICEKALLADLVVMGRRGINARFEYGLLGSATEGVIRKSPRPVLIVPEKFEIPANPLLAYDGSAFATKTMRSAAEFSKTLGLPLTVLTVARKKDEGTEILKGAEDYLKHYSIEAKFVCVEGEAPVDIEKYYKENNHDLLFMGPSRHSKVVEMVLGSTTEHVMRAVEGPFFLER